MELVSTQKPGYLKKPGFSLRGHEFHRAGMSRFDSNTRSGTIARHLATLSG